MGRLVAALVVLASLGVAACGDTTPSGTGGTGGATAIGATDLSAIELFVAAMADGRAGDGLAMPCEDFDPTGQIDPKGFQQALDLVIDLNGPIAVAGIEGVERPRDLRDRLAMPEEQIDPQQYKVHMSSKGRKLPDAMVFVVVGEQSDRRVCTTAADRPLLYASLLSRPPTNDFGETTRSPPDLVPTEIGHGFELSDEATFGPDPDVPGLVGGLLRVWEKAANGPTIRIRMSEFDAPLAAAEWIDASAAYATGSAVDTFETPSGAIGIRYMGESIVLIQTPDMAPYTDTVMLKLGSLVAQLSNFQSTPADHDLLVTLAEQMLSVDRG